MQEQDKPKKFYYMANEGHEDRQFINTKTYENGVIESDVEIESPFLHAVEVKAPETEVNSEQEANKEEQA